MSDDTIGERRGPLGEGGGLKSESDEARAEQAGGGDSEQEDQAVRESTDQLDTTGTQ